MSKPVEPTSNLINLSSPLNLADGTSLDALKVREPTVKDFRVSSQQSHNQEEREVIVVARCCGLTIEDLDSLKWKDYKKVQRFLFGEDDSEGHAE
ncbi:hypothetical protein A4G20_05665 [Pasteurellaceae bacterium RH1A]|nr:hypothetical protein A4G20_05665 [Pasteurellaceae bacterium RH1A]